MKKLLSLITAFLILNCSVIYAAPPQMNIEDTVVKLPLAEGVGFDDAVA